MKNFILKIYWLEYSTKVGNPEQKQKERKGECWGREIKKGKPRISPHRPSTLASVRTWGIRKELVVPICHCKDKDILLTKRKHSFDVSPFFCVNQLEMNQYASIIFFIFSHFPLLLLPILRRIPSKRQRAHATGQDPRSHRIH
jgi:hypothetical protein